MMLSSKHIRTKNVIRVKVAFAGVALLLACGYWSAASAIPAFARRYGTSCTTCHVVIPKLNYFGNAFKMNGYRVPPKDQAFVKQPDLKLGDPEWKEVWPKGFWPGAIPGNVPVAIRVDGDVFFNPGADISSDFDFPREVEVLAGGNAGDGFSYFLELAVEYDEIVLERAFAQFDQIIGSTLLNIKVGRYELAAVPFSRISRRLTASDFMTSDFRAVAGGFNFRERQQGIELWGAKSAIGGGGLRYGVGIVNGSGANRDNNSAKDLYYRLSYKVGGFGVAGSTGGAAATRFRQTNNWQDDSFRIGTFGYSGKGLLATGDNRFDRFGFDVDFWYGNLNIFGVLMHGRELRNTEQGFAFNTFFVETNYVFLPWVVGVLRYDHAGQPGQDIRRFVPGIVLAFRANVRFVNEAEIYLDSSGDSLVRTRLDFVF